VTLTLPTVTVAAGSGQTLTVSTSMPNGQADEIPANDGQSISGLDVGGEGVRVIIRTPNNPSPDFEWALSDEGGNFYVYGGPYTNQPNTTIDEFVCMSTDYGNQYRFVMNDWGMAGLCCDDGEGYWELRTPDGGLLLRDLFDNTVDGMQSPTMDPLSPTYGQGHQFYLPAGPANIHPDECGIMDNRVDNKVYAVKQTGNSYLGGTLNYQFEFSNPDSGRFRRIAKPRNYVIFSEMASLKPLLPGITYFARVRTDKAGPMAEAHWGTGCEMGLKRQSPCVTLINDPGHQYYSCGVERRFRPSSFIVATPVYGASQYRFRVFHTSEGYDQEFTRNTYTLELNWPASVAPPLVNGYTYQVQVSALINGVWSDYCDACPVTINNTPATQQGGKMVQVFGEATLWPNPVRDGQVNLTVDGIQEEVQRISVDVQDIYGQHVYGQEFENIGERFSTTLNLSSDIASGVYSVNITINGNLTTKRLTIVR
jgi:hypothetical protein